MTATRHDMVKATQCAREIEQACETIMQARAAMASALEDLGALLARTQPRTMFADRLFDCVRSSHNASLLAFNATELREYCEAHIPAAASRERVAAARRVFVCGGGATREVPA